MLTEIVCEILRIINTDIVPTDTILAKNLEKEIMTLYLNGKYGTDTSTTLRRLESYTKYVKESVGGDTREDITCAVSAMILYLKRNRT